MGYGSYSSDAMESLYTARATRSREEIFTESAPKEILPTNFEVRECRDSADHPNTLPIIVGLDVTGSMGSKAERLARQKLQKMLDVLHQHEVIDPVICIMGLGDAYIDRVPIQVGQFESEGTLVDKWLTSLELEGGGGGQIYESYSLAWYTAAHKTSCDAFAKGRKGFLITIGDEATWGITAAQIKKYFGESQATDLTAEELLQEVSRNWNVFHIHLDDCYYRSNEPRGQEVIAHWRKLLGERLYVLSNSDDAAEMIASIVATCSGANREKVLAGLGSARASVETALTVSKTDLASTSQETGMIHF